MVEDYSSWFDCHRLSSAYKSAPHNFLAFVESRLDAIEVALALGDTVRKVP